MKLPAEAKKSVSMTVVEEHDVNQSIAMSNSDDNTIRFFMNNAISSPAVKKALEGAISLKGKLVAVQQELGQVNQSLQVITTDQARIRANLREVPSTAPPYKRYLEKLEKQEAEFDKLQEQQKKLQAAEHGARQEFEAYLNNLNVK